MFEVKWHFYSSSEKLRNPMATTMTSHTTLLQRKGFSFSRLYRRSTSDKDFAFPQEPQNKRK